MVEEYFLGFDLSTQAIKVFIADRDLNLHCEVDLKHLICQSTAIDIIFLRFHLFYEAIAALFLTVRNSGVCQV